MRRERLVVSVPLLLDCKLESVHESAYVHVSGMPGGVLFSLETQCKIAYHCTSLLLKTMLMRKLCPSDVFSLM